VVEQDSCLVWEELDCAWCGVWRDWDPACGQLDGDPDAGLCYRCGGGGGGVCDRALGLVGEREGETAVEAGNAKFGSIAVRSSWGEVGSAEAVIWGEY
jgi:hypothetical protein